MNGFQIASVSSLARSLPITSSFQVIFEVNFLAPKKRSRNRSIRQLRVTKMHGECIELEHACLVGGFNQPI